MAKKKAARKPAAQSARRKGQSGSGFVPEELFAVEVDGQIRVAKKADTITKSAAKSLKMLTDALAALEKEGYVVMADAETPVDYEKLVIRRINQ